METIEDLRIQTVLEFGPGVSTEVFLAMECEVTSCEHDKNWLRKAHDRFGDRVSFYKYEGKGWGVLIFDLIAKAYDLGFVDGPLGGIVTPSRLNTALFAMTRCRFLAIHDTNRRGESKALECLIDLGCHIHRVMHSDRGLHLLETPLNFDHHSPGEGPGGSFLAGG